MTPGELRFATRLHTNLGEDFFCWYDVAVGQKMSRYPDFIVLNADLGLLSLEVKDWKLENIKSINKHSATITVGGKSKNLANPMEQVRQCTYALIQQMEKDPDLLDHLGPYEGRLRFPYGYGVVFPNITSDQVTMEGWEDIFPSHRAIYRDQMTESVDSEDFQNTIKEIFDVKFKHSLNNKMIDRVRWYIFPEVRISQDKDLFSTDISIDDTALEKSKIKQFDIEQEKLARSIGDGHRVIRGVAGSGKTQIIAYRCQYFAEAATKPILVLYFNIAAKALLKDHLRARGVLHKVHVMHFHEWCWEQLKKAGIRIGREEDIVKSFSDALAEFKITASQYSAVMVDEGKDFEKSWIKLIADFCETEKTPLLFVYDDAQSIYEKRTGLGFSLASAGIAAKGRTTILKTNYRNPELVRQLSSRFLMDVLTRNKDAQETEDEWIEPLGGGNIGSIPKIVICENPQDEASKIVRWLNNLHQQRAVPWADICVILRTRAQADALEATIERHDIPVYNVSKSQAAKKDFDLAHQSVKLTTVHSAKGLEFPNVLVMGICDYAHSGDQEIEGARLLYVAMTRSTDRLVLTAQRETPLVERMQNLLEEIATHPTDLT